MKKQKEPEAIRTINKSVRGRHFGLVMVAAFAVVILIAAYLHSDENLIANVLGSAIGALAAVWGGQYLSDYRAADSKRELVGILSTAVYNLMGEAETLGMVHMPEVSSMDPYIEGILRRIELRREHLAMFRPYRELGALELVELVSNLDTLCGEITTVLKTPRPGPDILPREEGAPIPQKYQIIEMQRDGDALTRACRETLTAFGLPWEHRRQDAG